MGTRAKTPEEMAGLGVAGDKCRAEWVVVAAAWVEWVVVAWVGDGPRRGNSGGSQSQQGPTVPCNGQSAVPVRLAEAKMNRGTVDPSALKPLNEYVIAVIGFPKSGFGPRRSQHSSDNDSDDSDARFADHLKVITVLSVGQERIGSDQGGAEIRGRDGRAIFHFEKSEPITLHDKDAEFRITGDRMEIRKKFALKDMEFQGKLAL